LTAGRQNARTQFPLKMPTNSMAWLMAIH